MTAFPDAPLDVRSELLINSTWTDVSLYQDHGPISIGRGHPDESTTVSPSTKAITWTSNDARFSSKNPTSPYWPYLVRNAQCRVSIPAQANYLRLESAQARAFVNDTTALHITGSIEMRIQLQLTGLSASVLACKWDGGGCWSFVLNDNGTLQFTWADSGAVQHSVTSAALPAFTGSQALRVTMDATNGNVAFYTAASIDASYTQLGSTASGTGGAATSIFSSTVSALAVGYSFSIFGGAGQLHGRVAEYRLYSGIGGTIVADGIFSAQSPGTTTWTDSPGRTWLLGAAAEISSRDYRLHTEVPEWPQHQDPTGKTWTVSAAGGGLLRRLSQRNNALNSAMWRAWVKTGTQLAGYWPLEDGAGAQSLASGIGGPAAAFSGPLQLATNSDFACSAPLPVLNGTVIVGRVPAYSAAWAGNQVSWLMEIPSGGEFNGAEVMRIATTGTVAQVVVVYGTGGSLTPSFYNAAGTLLAGGGAVTFNADGQQFLMVISLTPDGSGGVNWALEAATPGGTGFAGATGNIASASVGAVTSWTLDGGGQLLQTVAGHVAVQAAPSIWDVTAFGAALIAHAGEAPGRRFQRLCSEEGIEFRAGGNLDDTPLMGAQSQQTLTQLLQECADAGRAVWYELRQVLGWGYVPRSALYNQPAAVALSYSQDMLSEWASDPTEDDQVIRNDETVSQATGGGMARQYAAPGQAITGGRLSVLAPPDGAGTYDGSDSLNVWLASDLPSLASWIVHVGTVDEPRYPGLVLDLSNRTLASLFYSILGLELGQRVTISSPPGQLGPDTISVLAAQLTEELWGDTLVITMAGVPSSPYHVAQEGASTGRADGSGSALTGPVTAGATALPVVSSGPQWSGAVADVPYDLRVGAERVTLSAAAAGSRPGMLMGASLNATYLSSAATWAAEAAAWTSLTGLSVPVTRIYKGPSQFAYNFSDVVAAGTRICLSLQPAYNPVSSADLASITTLMQSLTAAGADVEVALWHEPFFSGLSAAQYIAAYRYYGPTVRQYYPLWSVFSGPDTAASAGYYPGSNWVDGIAVDAYAGPGSNGVASAQGSVLAAMAIADNGGKPFGVWEFGGGVDFGISPPPQAQSQAGVTSFFAFLQALMLQRVALGLPCGNVIFFSSGQSSSASISFLGSGLGQNAGAEGGGGNWASGSGTFGTSGAQAHSGSSSFTITSTGAGTANIVSCTLGNILTQGLVCNPGDLVGGSGWFRAQATARSSTVRLEFADSGGASLSTVTGTAVSDATTGWGTTPWAVSTTAPASTARARLVAAVAGIAGAGEIHYFDDAQLGTIPSNDLTSPLQFSWDYRVSLLAAMQAALSPGSYAQALTVTRAVNGVSRAWPAGTAVALWDTPVAAL